MPSDLVSVTLGVGNASYQKTLIPCLLRMGMLRRVLSMSRYFDIQDPDPDGTLRLVKQFPVSGFGDRVLWALWRRVPAKVRPRSPVMVRIRLSDQLWSGWIPPCSVFHAWMGLCLASLTAAKRQGAVTLLENPGRHARHWYEAGADECRRFGIDPRKHTKLPSALIRRIEREYELCDRIIVPSTLAHRSLAEFGLGDKTVVVAPGVDTDLFSPRPRPKEGSVFRACFVGRVELAKGAGYLLKAWKRLALPNAELVLVGEVKPEMNSLLQNYADSTVRTTGVLPPALLAEVYRQSDLFVFPSVNEGLAQVLFEAMSSGLPVVASDYSGAVDLVTEGKDGFIVPARDMDRLSEAISWCYYHPDDLRLMGRAARAKIESDFTLDHYSQRQIALYRDLTAR